MGKPLPFTFLGIVLKKLNLAQQKQTTQEENSLSQSTKTQNAKPKQMHKD